MYINLIDDVFFGFVIGLVCCKICFSFKIFFKILKYFWICFKLFQRLIVFINLFFVIEVIVIKSCIFVGLFRVLQEVIVIGWMLIQLIYFYFIYCLFIYECFVNGLVQVLIVNDGL